MKSNAPLRQKPGSRFAPMFAVSLASLLAMPVHAAVDVPRVPPSAGNGIPPNILFILDDSGSMAFDAMPMSSIGSSFKDRSYVHNTIYYNPFQPYKPWLTADGTRMTGGTSYDAVYPSFNYARGTTISLFNSSSCQSVDKNNSNQNVCGGTQTFYVPKDPTNTSAAYLDDINNFYRYQILSNGSIERRERTYAWGGWGWRNATAATPTGRTEAAERANYAIWFSYHRTRMKVAKAGAAEAFGGLAEDEYRVGFTTIWGPNGGGADNDQFLIPVQNDNGLFRDDNREEWFDVLFDARGYNGTPLRNALKRAGEYYSDSSSSGPYGGNLDADNEQFQCRQNFSILTTDGFWNGANPSGIGDADNTAGDLISAPMLDNGSPGATYQYQPTAPYSSSDSVSLADVAMAYWKKDLRTDMDNILPASVANPAFWQHMVTFGISIGLSGTLDQTSVAAVMKQGGVTRNQTPLSGWPNPMNTEDRERIDDLLHAAVNGRGEFVAATDPTAFAKGLEAALSTITDRTGSASSVAASSTSISTNTRLFQAKYLGASWTGELEAYAVTDSGIDTLNPIWKASEELPAWGNRKVFTTDSTGARGTFPTATQTAALGVSAKGHSYADYILGDDSGEIDNDGDLRTRSSLLGDIIHSSPYYNQPTDTLYVGANDGMLHAFNGTNGREVFAYVPRGVAMSELRELASPDYAHRYFVDGPVVVSDRSLTRTAPHPNGRDILVGTLGRGGKGVFGLDVSNPGTFNASRVLFDTAGDADMGLVLGEPLIARLNDGSVSVIFGNGINSANESAVLWIINVDTGAVTKIDTKATGNNGLSAPRGWDADGNGTVDLVYAGDQLGNLWSFELGDNTNQWGVALGSKNNPAPLFTATDAGGKRQPISGRISIGIDPVNYQRWVFFGTGRMLNDADLWNSDGSPNLDVQSMYGIIDGSASIGTRAANDGQGDPNGLVQRTIQALGAADDGTPVRAFETAVDNLPPGKRGWFVDMLTPPNGTAEGERIVGNSQIVGSVLLTSSIIPSQNPCTPGGRGYLNAINAFTGASVGEHFFDVDGDGEFTDDEIGDVPVGSVDLGVGMPTDGVLIDNLIGIGGSNGNSSSVNIKNPASSGRVSWREILRK